MGRRLSERAQAAIFLVALAVAIAGLYAYIQGAAAPPVGAKAEVTASLTIDGGAWSLRYGPVATRNTTVFGLLLEASRHLGFAVRWVNYTLMGVFVTSINGTANGQGGLNWYYWVNGTLGGVAADRYALPDGAAVAWRFTTDQGGV